MSHRTRGLPEIGSFGTNADCAEPDFGHTRAGFPGTKPGCQHEVAARCRERSSALRPDCEASDRAYPLCAMPAITPTTRVTGRAFRWQKAGDARGEGHGIKGG